jgi:hypothetical protein
MGSLYRSRHELVFVFGERDARRVNNVKLGKYGRNRTNVWHYPGAKLVRAPRSNSRSRTSSDRQTHRHGRRRDRRRHEPRRHRSRPLRRERHDDSRCRADGRRGYAIELDPGHLDTAVVRWQRMTKKIALHANGKTFEEIRAERRRAEEAT